MVEKRNQNSHKTKQILKGAENAKNNKSTIF